MIRKLEDIVIYTPKEAEKELQGQEGASELKRLLEWQHVKFSKVYMLSDCIVGAILLDVKIGGEGLSYIVPYYLDRERMFLVAGEGNKEKIKEMLSKAEQDQNAVPELSFCGLLEALLVNDLEYMQQMEEDCYKLEENLLGSLIDYVEPTKQILSCRKHLLAREFYYQQLADLTDILAGNKNEFFSDRALNVIEDIGKRADRLCGYVQTLREYLVQVWELYEQQIDVQQNKTMRILTVVTTIFLPLTLMAGWYGMNFKYMPELSSEYGYWTVMGVAILIVIGEITYFRKKRYF